MWFKSMFKLTGNWVINKAGYAAETISMLKHCHFELGWFGPKINNDQPSFS